MSAENNRTEWGVGMNGAERMLQNTKYNMLMMTMSDVKVENIWAIMIALMMMMLMMILAMMK